MPSTSKTLRDIEARDSRIDEYFADSDGHWMYTHRGYAFDVAGPSHVERTDTVAEMRKALRWIEPCDCSWCTGESG